MDSDRNGPGRAARSRILAAVDCPVCEQRRAFPEILPPAGGADGRFVTGGAKPPPGPPPRRRQPTVTSSFGVGRRESHDASGFYDRFTAPTVSPDQAIGRRLQPVDVLVTGDARAMNAVDDATVALVVTSPPYLSA